MNSIVKNRNHLKNSACCVCCLCVTQKKKTKAWVATPKIFTWKLWSNHHRRRCVFDMNVNDVRRPQYSVRKPPTTIVHFRQSVSPAIPANSPWSCHVWKWTNHTGKLYDDLSDPIRVGSNKTISSYSKSFPILYLQSASAQCWIQE